MYEYKYKVYFPATGVIWESDSIKSVYKAAERERRYCKSYSYGMKGYTITSKGKVIYTAKDGEDVTLQEAEVSVRLYNVTMRKLLMDGKLDKDQRDIKLGDLRKLVEEGAMTNVRNAGTKTYAELFTLLRKYTGWSEKPQIALENCMSNTPRGIKWLDDHCPGWGRTE